MMDSATLVKGLLMGAIIFLAARKLRGIAKMTPNVVARRARKTVSTILSQVWRAFSLKRGVPMLRRVMARML
jgi:hypothetical protein